MVSGGAHRISFSYQSPPCPLRTMLKCLQVLARTSTRSTAFIFNTSALQLHLAITRNDFNACFPKAQWRKLQLFALDPVDLALSKLERNSDRDREDVLPLSQAGYIDSAD